MSNTATYLNKEQKEKLARIATLSHVSESRVLQLAVQFMPEDYFIRLVNTYRESD